MIEKNESNVDLKYLDKSTNTHTHTHRDIDETSESKDINEKHKVGLALCCIDYRFIDKTIDFLKNKSKNIEFNLITLSGSSLGFNEGNDCWKNTFLEHIDITIKLYNINQIYVIDHDECDSYKYYYSDIHKDPDLEEEYHYINMLQFKKKLKKIYPNIPVYTHFLKNDCTQV